MTKSSATSITGDCPGLDFCGWNLSNQVNGKLGIDLFRGALEKHQTVIISFPVPVCVTGSLVPWLLSFTEVVENAEKEFIVHFFCKFANYTECTQMVSRHCCVSPC